MHGHKTEKTVSKNKTEKQWCHCKLCSLINAERLFLTVLPCLRHVTLVPVHFVHHAVSRSQLLRLLLLHYVVLGDLDCLSGAAPSCHPLLPYHGCYRPGHGRGVADPWHLALRGSCCSWSLNDDYVLGEYLYHKMQLYHYIGNKPSIIVIRTKHGKKARQM